MSSLSLEKSKSAIENGVLRLKTMVFSLKFSAALGFQQAACPHSLLQKKDRSYACIPLDFHRGLVD